MKLLSILLLFSSFARGQTHTIRLDVNLGDFDPASIRDEWRYPRMDAKDYSTITVGKGFVITWYDHTPGIDSTKAYSEIFKNEDFNKGRGVICFYLDFSHNWVSCDCWPIDSALNELRGRYKYDKVFRDRKDSIMRTEIERLQKNMKP